MPAKPTPGSITSTADVQKDRINNISNVSRAINQMQKDVDQKIAETDKQVERKTEVQAVQSLMNQSVSKLNQTIGALTTGVARITTDTARATAGAINQYGKAISEDISFNKKSVVAMALAKTSPIYGYFVAKFMETNVWKQALTKMKSSIMQTMGAILRPFKGGAARGGSVPHAQTGGYIGQGGLAKVHAGETITPAGGGGVGLGDLSELVSIQRQQLDYMQKTYGFESKYYKSWFQRMSPMRVVRAFRRTKGNYTAALSTETRPLVNIAENIATLYSQLMWRLDTLMKIERANAIANRDLTTFFTGIKYPPIPGVKLRELVKPFIRKVVGSLVKNAPLITAVTMAALGAPGTAIAGVVGLAGAKKIIGRRVKEGRGTKAENFLMKERGAYAGVRAPSFGERMRGKFRRMFPTRAMLEEQGEGLQGSSGPRRAVVRFGASKKRELAQQGSSIAIGFSKIFGGRLGVRRPIWVSSLSDKKALEYYQFSKIHDKVQTKQMKKIRDSNQNQYELQKKAYKRAGKWRFVDKIWGFVKTGFGFIGGIFDTISNTLSNVLGGALTGVFTNPVVLAAIGGAILEYVAVTALFDKFWAWWKTRDKRQRQYGREISDIRGSWAKTSGTVTGIRGYKAQTRIEASKFAPDSNVGDAKLNEIRRGQLDFIDQNTNQYMEFPLDKISGWRSEWSKRYGERMLGQDPYKYGQTREQKFLNYLNSVKKGEKLSDKQKSEAIAARDQQITKINPNAVQQEKEYQKIHGPLKQGEGFKPPETQKQKANRYEAMRQKGRALLRNKYGMKDPKRIDALLDSILPNAKTSLFDNAPGMMDFIESELKNRNIIPTDATGVAKDLFQPKRLDPNAVGKIDANTEKKKGELQNQTVVGGLKKVEDAVKEKPAGNVIIQNNKQENSSQVNSSISDATSITNGRGNTKSGPYQDPWHVKAILAGGQ